MTVPDRITEIRRTHDLGHATELAHRGEVSTPCDRCTLLAALDEAQTVNRVQDTAISRANEMITELETQLAAAQARADDLYQRRGEDIYKRLTDYEAQLAAERAQCAALKVHLERQGEANEHQAKRDTATIVAISRELAAERAARQRAEQIAAAKDAAVIASDQENTALEQRLQRAEQERDEARGSIAELLAELRALAPWSLPDNTPCWCPSPNHWYGHKADNPNCTKRRAVYARARLAQEKGK